MNPDLKNLRVAVIPTETGNGINQSSTVEEILNCDELQLYPLTNYFKAQNDEEIDLLHWSFLIDIEKKKDLTGTNIDGIHMNIKSRKIIELKEKHEKLRTILINYGCEEHGNYIIDEISELFGEKPTTVYYEE